jgi:DNA-binding transcriptional MerR regulator
MGNTGKARTNRNAYPEGLRLHLNEVAELCGVSSARLAEWTDLGYVRAEGQGQGRLYGADAIEVILRLRDAVPLARIKTLPCAIPAQDVAAIRPAEFAPCAHTLTDEQVALRIQVLFLMNPSTAFTAQEIAARICAPENRVMEVAYRLVNERHLAFADGCWRAAEPRWRGIRLREQRVRAARRKRLSAERPD